MNYNALSRRRFVQGALVAGAGLGMGRRSLAKGVSIPELALWEAQMVKFGAQHAQGLADTTGPLDPLLGATYYDAQRVFYQIADYTRDDSWLVAASHAMAVYRDRYVLQYQGAVPGYWIFPHGLAMNFQRTGDAASREAVMLMSQNAAYAPDWTSADWTQSADMSREVAYNLMCLLEAESLGAAPRDRRDLLMNQALGHIDQWFVSRTAGFVQTFMFALTAEALISYYERIQDPRIPEALQTGADWIWRNMWIQTAEAFQYNTVDQQPAADLNLLIAPIFAWLYRWTGQTYYRDQGDAVFAGGVKNAWLGGAKQFNQSYRWSFKYVAWRSAGPLPRKRARR